MTKKKQYYFIYNGTIIKPGAILKIRPWRGVEEVIFEWYVPEMDLYVFKYKGRNGMVGSGMTGVEFKQYLICPTGEIDEYITREYQVKMETDKLTFAKELEIDGMAIAWLWFIVLMAVTFIFNGNLFYWVVISICFFIYRYGKLREEGYK